MFIPWQFIFLFSLLIDLELSSGFGRQRATCAPPQTQSSRHFYVLNSKNRDNNIQQKKRVLSDDEVESNRRKLLKNGVLLATCSLELAPAESLLAAGEEKQHQANGMVSTTALADRLRVVPTFTIVDPKGIPYMVVGEDAKVTGYFFTTYGEANRLLTLARTSADKNIREALTELRTQRKKEKLPALSKQEEIDQVGVNPWKSARISAVPLDVAVTLVTKSMYSRKTGGGNYFQVAPAESDVEDALGLDKNGKDELAEGRVPLFYFADFELMDGDSKQSPLYFRKSELVEAWKKQNPSVEVPEIRVTEMFSVLTEMVKPGGNDTDLQSLVFVAPKESAQMAKQCIKAGGKESSFVVGQRIVVL
jgi:hypothetical protein